MTTPRRTPEATLAESRAGPTTNGPSCPRKLPTGRCHSIDLTAARLGRHNLHEVRQVRPLPLPPTCPGPSAGVHVPTEPRTQTRLSCAHIPEPGANEAMDELGHGGQWPSAGTRVPRGRPRLSPSVSPSFPPSLPMGSPLTPAVGSLRPSLLLHSTHSSPSVLCPGPELYGWVA